LHDKRNTLYFFVVSILFFLLILNGCQPSGSLPESEPPDVENDPQENEAVNREDKEMTDDEIENSSELDSEEISQNSLITLQFIAGDFILSPDSNFLYFTTPSDPETLYHVIDLTVAEIDAQATPEIGWEALEALPTPSIIGNTYHLQIAGVSNNLLYATSEILWDETEYGEKTVIYFSRQEFPADIYDQIEITGDEVPYFATGPGIKPSWDDDNNVFYLTISGIYNYSTESRNQTLVRPADRLEGLVLEGQLAPHAFYLGNDKNELAYYNDNTIYLVSLDRRLDNPETIKIDSGGRDIVGIDYLFDDRYLVLADSYAKSGYWLDDLSLTFIDRLSGEIIMENNEYMPAGYNLDDQGRMLFKSRGPGDEGYFVLLDDNLTEQGRVPAKGIVSDEDFFSYANAIWLDGRWALPVYIEMETHFIEIDFD